MRAGPRWVAVALTYVGAVVGAGFASGQEIYQFFSRHGSLGTAGIVVAGALFFVLGRLALLAGAAGDRDLPRLLRRTYSDRATRWLDAASSLLLVVGLVVVAAAGGSVLRALLGWPLPLGTFVTLGVVLLVAAGGSEAVLGANTILVPMLLAITVGVALFSPRAWSGPPAAGWWMSAVLYVSYNLFTGLVVLLTIGATLPKGRGATAAAGLGAGLLTLMALLIHGAILGASLKRLPDLPMLVLAHRISGPWAAADSLALYAALGTTGVAEAYALAARYGPRRIWMGLWLWPLSWIGFAEWVAWGYPAMGAFALAYVWPLMARRRRKPPSIDRRTR
jgi:uncharacterized membrane protein YkvI